VTISVQLLNYNATGHPFRMCAVVGQVELHNKHFALHHLHRLTVVGKVSEAARKSKDNLPG